MASNICEPQNVPQKSQHSAGLGQNWWKIISKSRNQTSHQPCPLLGEPLHRNNYQEMTDTLLIQFSPPLGSTGLLGDKCTCQEIFVAVTTVSNATDTLWAQTSHPQDTSTENDSAQGGATLREPTFTNMPKSGSGSVFGGSVLETQGNEPFKNKTEVCGERWSVVKGTCCSCKGPRFNSQCSCDGSQQSANSSSRVYDSRCRPPLAPSTHMTHIRKCRQNIHTK